MMTLIPLGADDQTLFDGWFGQAAPENRFVEYYQNIGNWLTLIDGETRFGLIAEVCRSGIDARHWFVFLHSVGHECPTYTCRAGLSENACRVAGVELSILPKFSHLRFCTPMPLIVWPLRRPDPQAG